MGESKREISKSKRLVLLIMLMTICIIGSLKSPEGEAISAQDKHIRVNDFIEHLVRQAKIPVDKSSDKPYIDAAMEKGILKKGDFENYNDYLTRGDCAVLANRLDEYLHGKYYGYSEELYNFLKGCEYYKGRLCYNLKEGLYPVGRDTYKYKAVDFYNNKVKPIIDSSFTFNREIRVAYIDLFDEGEILDTYLEIGYKPYRETNYTGIDPIEYDHPIIKDWRNVIDQERKLQAVYDKRISDINSIPEEKRLDIANIVAKGIIKGFNNGMYVQNREFRASRKITANGAKNVISMVINPEERSVISPDGQLIRTSKLPKNADKYPYILACFPNEFYEMPMEFETRDISRYKDYDIRYPVEAGNEAIEKKYVNFLLLGMEPYEYYDTIMNQVEQYVTNVLNVDYRTVDEEWVEKVTSTYTPTITGGVYDRIEEYLSSMKKNHVIVESKLISVEPSSMYYFYGDYYVRVYAKYKVTADTLDVEDDCELVFGGLSTTHLLKLKNNEWTYGYYDIQVNSSNIDTETFDKFQSYMHFGVAPWAGLSDINMKSIR